MFGSKRREIDKLLAESARMRGRIDDLERSLIHTRAKIPAPVYTYGVRLGDGGTIWKIKAEIFLQRDQGFVFYSGGRVIARFPIDEAVIVEEG